ncbi:MAG: ATP-binding cassette domain-containing protein [Gemmatimonadota bacterium]
MNEPTAPTPSTSVLEAHGLSKDYGGHQALIDLDLRVDAGEIYCLLGPNGAGKTTTVNLFLGFLAPSSGTVSVAGLDVARHDRETKAHLAYIPEQVMLYKNLSGLENLEYFTALAGRSTEGGVLRGALTDAGLQADAVDRRVSEYSKGMRQKVGIAIAIAKDARALLLDEPTSGLDPKASNEFSELLRRMRDRGVAVLMATHDLFRAKETGTRVGIMRDGRLVRELATADIGHAELESVYLDHMVEEVVA